MLTCQLENGHKYNLRHVTVRVIAPNNRNEVLLIKRAPNELRGGKYNLPGGFLDRDENTESAALRELVEETGIEGKVDYLLRINDNPQRPNEDRQNVDFVYVVKDIKGSVKIDHESTDAGWFSEGNLPNREEFAFDDLDSILMYFRYLKEPFKLPIIG